MAFLTHIYFVCRMFRFRQFWADFGKNTFSHKWPLYTVTQDDNELRQAAHVFGWWWGWGRTSICGMAKD
jgi:hypothetical protein